MDWRVHVSYLKITDPATQPTKELKAITSWKFAEKLHHCYAITYWAMDERIYLYMMALCSNWWWCCTCTREKNINKQVFVMGITSKQSFEKFFFHFKDYKMGVVYYIWVYK